MILQLTELFLSLGKNGTIDLFRSLSFIKIWNLCAVRDGGLAELPRFSVDKFT
jgi:hypothetical protein